MKFKKLVTTALAGAMALSLSVPAFAAEVKPNVTDITEPTEVEVTGTTEVPAIKLVVPTSANVVVNPYRLEVDVAGAKVTEQIVSAAQFIQNKSPVAVEVKTSVTGTAEGAAKFSETAVADTATDNLVYVSFEIMPTEDTTAPSAWTGAKSVVLKTEKVEVDAVTMAKDGDETANATPNAAFHFTGSAAAAPTTPWTADDIIGATIAFSFTAKANAAAPAAPAT